MVSTNHVCIPNRLVDEIIGFIHDKVSEDQRMAIEQKLVELTQNQDMETTSKPRSEYDQLQQVWEQNHKYFIDHEEELKTT